MMSYLRWTRGFLILIALHSFIVGLCLIFLDTKVFESFGFYISERFFPAQGGAFHLVMVVAYLGAAINIKRSTALIWFSVAAKMMATVFLLAYYFITNGGWVILLSGIADFLMGAVLWGLFIGYKKSIYADQG